MRPLNAAPTGGFLLRALNVWEILFMGRVAEP